MSTANIGLVFGSGGLGTGGYYNEMGLKGLQQAKADLGIEFDYRLPSHDEDFEPLLRDLAESGRYHLIGVMSFGASAGLKRVAADFPAQKFAAFDAYAEGPNVASYASEPKSVSFLAGAAAAWLSQTGKIGCLFGTEGPGYWQWVASYMAGAKTARPAVEVAYEFLPVYSPSADAGEAAAARQYAQGVDVIMAHLDQGDPGIFAAARQRHTYAIGFNGERRLDPEHILFDVTRHLEVSIYDAVQRVVQGKFVAGTTSWGMERGQYALEFGEPAHSRITDEVRAAIAAHAAALKRGQFGALPATLAAVDPFLLARRGSPTVS